MSSWKIELLIIGFILLIGTVSADVILPDSFAITSSADADGHHGWLVANGVDRTTITISVSANPILVSLSVNPAYGKLSATNLVTGSSGIVTATFTANKTSIMNLPLNITASNSTHSVSKTQYLNIDHDQTYYTNFNYQREVVVNQTTPFMVTLTDRWGNRVDNKNPAYIHTVKFVMNSPPGGLGNGGLKNATSAYFTKFSDNTDSNGNISLTARVDTAIGENIIWVSANEGNINLYPFITGISEVMPYSMTTSIIPTGVPRPFVIANGVEKFYITYTVLDVYGNPIGNRTVRINTTQYGENILASSNYLGQILLTYGPKETAINEIAITATSVDNSSVRNLSSFDFRPSSGESMVLAVTPQTMASRETKPSERAEVLAKVLDSKGNPVPGELVAFQISDINTGSYVVTGQPSLNSTSTVSTITATTNSDGNAIIYFYPGNFTIQQNDPGYNSTATGSCKVTATWNSATSEWKKQATLVWKNYPYLSVLTKVEPATVAINQNIDVTIQVIGDGYMMGTRPVTVMLDMDASSSLNSGSRGPDAKASSKKFVDNLSPTQDQVGLVSYGDNDNEVFHSNASYNYQLVKQEIDNLTLKGGVSGGGIGVKQSVDEAVYRIMHNPSLHPQEVRAIILLGDTPYNHGDLTTLVKETWGSDGNRIRVFTIVFLSSGGGCGSTTDDKLIRLKDLAEQAGGKYYCGADKDAIDNAYAEIAGILRMLAGVNTTMSLSFENVQVNSTPMSGGAVFSYVPVGPFTPLQSVINPSGRTSIIWPNGTQSVVNQSDQWTAANKYQLNFTVGNIRVGDQWTTKFTLKVLKDGSISLFGPGSKISFTTEEGPMSVDLPETIVIATNQTNTGVSSSALDVSNLHSTTDKIIVDFIPLEWNLAYNGTYQVTESLWYSNNGGEWILFANHGASNSTVVDTIELDVRSLPSGSYSIKLKASAPDAPDDYEYILAPGVTVGTQGRAYIKLE